MKTPGLFTASAAFLLFSLGGCAQEAVFSPPPNSEQVTVSVKVPKDLAADTMHVMYRSAKCPSKESADGVPYEIDGFYPIDVAPRQVGQSDLYEAKLARDGGGACQWKLSNVTFGVHYENTAQFGGGVKYGRGGGVIVIFDNNHPQEQTGEGIEIVEGDLSIRKEYYPWIIENFLSGHRVKINIFGIKDTETYLAKKAKQIHFEPILHDNLIVKTLGVRDRNSNEQAKNSYPDGTISDSNSRPRFQKLQELTPPKPTD
ncbi:MAG: hypothetical protein CTR55_07185 [Pseudomonas sp.]|uniref:hypothetical protein n=1 Tax=Pseudomonas sp. TaxID=306 RepID=UPI000CA782A2|nr:hypothetical protein [Pseudomonas sp.]PJI49145.1 MAG: hypothetical protein CTR55_07185 [Pseudomonas sp.]